MHSCTHTHVQRHSIEAQTNSLHLLVPFSCHPVQVKVWSMLENKPALLATENLNVGAVFGMSFCRQACGWGCPVMPACLPVCLSAALLLTGWQLAWHVPLPSRCRCKLCSGCTHCPTVQH